jgi:hypothetical protein
MPLLCRDTAATTRWVCGHKYINGDAARITCYPVDGVQFLAQTE